MLLSKILILSCMIIIYNVEENIFVTIFYKLLVKKKNCIEKSYWKLDWFKINGKQWMKLRNYVTKIKSPFIIYENFESILVPENKSNIHKNLIPTNFKNILLVITVIN